MPSVSRALPLAFACVLATLTLHAQTEGLPPIFAPRAEPPLTAAAAARSVAPLSDYLRKALNETVLANAEAFVVPPRPLAAGTAAPTYSAEGALLMPRFLVKSKVPERKEVTPPPLVLYTFAPMERVDRKRTAWSANLWSSSDGLKTLELNVVNGAGFGLDHNLDLTRVELAFRVRF